MLTNILTKYLCKSPTFKWTDGLIDRKPKSHTFQPFSIFKITKETIICYNKDNLSLSIFIFITALRYKKLLMLSIFIYGII